MPTDTIIQTMAQAMGGSGYAVAVLLLAAFLITGCVVGVIGSVIDARQRRMEERQRRLEDSVRRAGGEQWKSSLK